jgi:hypothetical protein
MRKNADGSVLPSVIVPGSLKATEASVSSSVIVHICLPNMQMRTITQGIQRFD